MPCRRRSLLTLLPAGLLPAALLAGCATMPEAGVVGEPRAVAPGVYLVRGAPGEIDAANGGRIGNAGFVVGERGVLVVDSGSAERHGLALQAAVRQVTDRPVRALLLTHARQEFVFGARAFQRAGVPVLMGRASAQLMAARCGGCLKTLERVLGNEVMAGTELVKPDRLIDALPGRPEPLPADLAEAIGRPLSLLGFGHSSGPGDLALRDDTTGWLFTGGLADVQRVPDLQDADLPGWHRALDALRALPLAGIVPGHGPAGRPQALAEVQAYLRALDERERQLARDGVALSEVPDRSDLAAYAGWEQYDTIHRRNASILFLRHERALLRG